MLYNPLNHRLIAALLSLTLIPIFGDLIVPIPAKTEILTQEVSSRKADADKILVRGKKAYRLSEYTEALELFKQALKIYQTLGERRSEGVVFNEMGLVYWNLGQYEPSLDFYTKSLQIAEEFGNEQEQGTILSNMGLVYWNLGQHQKALEIHQRALKIKRKIADRNGEGITLNNIGLVYDSLGKYQQALDYYQQALKIYREVGNLNDEGISLNNVGLVYDNWGQYQKALDYYQQALKIYEQVKNRNEMGTTLGNIGFVYNNLGEYEQALKFYERALVIKQDIGNRLGESGIFNKIGLAYWNLGNHEKALDYYQQALFIRKEIGDRNGEGVSLNNIGLIYGNLGEYDKALEYYQKALEIYDEVGDRQSEGRCLNNIGVIYWTLKEYEKALNYYQQALTIIRETGDRSIERTTLSNLGYVYADLNNYPEAERYLFLSLEVLESLRSGLKDQDKISIFETQTYTYNFLQSILVKQNKIEQALEVAERGRARALVELLSSHIHEETPQIKPPNISEIKKIAQSNNATIVQYSILTDKLLIWVIQPTGNINFNTVNLPSGQLENIAQRGRIATALGRSRSDENEQIQTLVRGTYDTLKTSINTSTKNLPFTIINLQELYQLLIKPIENFLPTDPDTHVIFIPHQSLFLVPFASLQDEQGRYLIEKHTILIESSIQQLDLSHQLLMKNRQAHPQSSLIVGIPRKSIVLGNPAPMPSIIIPNGQSQQLPNLEGAEKEAESIAQLLQTSALLGNQATKRMVLQQLSDAKIIHLATHGLLDEFGTGIPGALAFAPSGNDNGLLTSSEIFNLKLNAELVVLSACNTGRGKLTQDGVIGLSRSFLSAGVPSIIVSLWSVNDESTAFLMTQFYQNWLLGKMDKAQSLRKAMLSTLEKYPNPSQWSAFTLIGETE